MTALRCGTPTILTKKFSVTIDRTNIVKSYLLQKSNKIVI